MTKNNQLQFKQTSVGEIPKDWEVLKVENLAEVVGGSTPSTKNPDNFNGNIPWITPRDLSNFSKRYIKNGKRNITQKGFNGSGTKLLPKNSILLTSRAPVGYLAIAENEVTTNQGFKSLIPKKNTNFLFLFYLLKNDISRLKDHATGSTFQELSGSTLKKIEYFLPPLPEQQKIAGVLGSLDDKIEMLEKQNRTLESLGQTIFKKWFIDSDEEENSTFKEIAKIVTGKRPNSKSSNKTDKFNIPIIGAGGIMGYTNETIYNEDIIVTGRVGTHGIIQRIDDSCWTSDNTLVTISDYPNFTYYIMKTIDFHSLNRGSTQPLITQTDLQNYPIYLPEKNEIEKFETIAEILFEKISLNGNMIYNLSQTRDLLLPKLMSGKVRMR